MPLDELKSEERACGNCKDRPSSYRCPRVGVERSSPCAFWAESRPSILKRAEKHITELESLKAVQRACLSDLTERRDELKKRIAELEAEVARLRIANDEIKQQWAWDVDNLRQESVPKGGA